MTALVIPMPRIAPINVCELDAGKLRYQVPRFQTIAAVKRARTIAMPVPDPIETRSSTGRRCTMLKATAVPPRWTPMKLQMPDNTTAVRGRSDLV